MAREELCQEVVDAVPERAFQLDSKEFFCSRQSFLTRGHICEDGLMSRFRVVGCRSFAAHAHDPRRTPEMNRTAAAIAVLGDNDPEEVEVLKRA